MSLPFQGLCDTTLTDLESSSQSLNCAKNTTLLTADTPWRKVYWLHSGVARMYYLGLDGCEHNKRFFLAGEVFWPVSSGLREQPAGFYIGTLTSISGCYWEFDQFKRAFKDDQKWLNFSRIWLERLLDAKLTREREWLHLSAVQRYQQLCHNAPDLVAQVPAHHIASYLGITPVSLSRLKKSLEINI